MTIIGIAPVPASRNLAGLDTLTTFRPIPAGLPACPFWCTVNHDEDGVERLHSREMVELTALAGDDLHETRDIWVELDAFESPALPGGIDPTTIYLAMGTERTQQSSANLTPELAEQLAAALFEAARLARQARR